MFTGSILLGAPAPVDPSRTVFVACPTCGWWEQSTRVRQACPVDDRHAAPIAVYAWVECRQGCGGGWYRRPPTGCSGGTHHQLRITEFKRHP
ncbi:hypothetical protein [Paractinoplanes ferrugineus]|nr:hypothetical protein [Actinoplanes ferrugineus]